MGCVSEVVMATMRALARKNVETNCVEKGGGGGEDYNIISLSPSYKTRKMLF
jgi:hypothetical protein